MADTLDSLTKRVLQLSVAEQLELAERIYDQIGDRFRPLDSKKAGQTLVASVIDERQARWSDMRPTCNAC